MCPGQGHLLFHNLNEIEVLPVSLSFGSVKVSEFSQKTFTIRNTGTSVLNVNGITAPDGFTVDKSSDGMTTVK